MPWTVYATDYTAAWSNLQSATYKATGAEATVNQCQSYVGKSTYAWVTDDIGISPEAARILGGTLGEGWYVYKHRTVIIPLGMSNKLKLHTNSMEWEHKL